MHPSHSPSLQLSDDHAPALPAPVITEGLAGACPADTGDLDPEMRESFAFIESIVASVREEMPSASDIQFVGGSVVWIHADGEEHRTSTVVTNEDILMWSKIFGRIRNGKYGDEQLRDGIEGTVENAFDLAGVRLRAAFRRQYGGYALNVRILLQTPPGITHRMFDKNPVPEPLIKLVEDSSAGIILVTGPTGSGKSFLLAALLDNVNEQQRRHIYTLEDPVEFVHQSKKSLITQREIGTHTNSFVQGIMTAKRSKPGIILLGELRDKETMRAALESAGEGHLVLATTHASSVAETVATFVGHFPADEQNQVAVRVAQTFLAVISQRLVAGTDGKMVAVREMMIADNTLQSILKNPTDADKLEKQLLSSASRDKPGVFSRDDDLIKLCVQGLITPDVAIQYCHQPGEVREKLRRAKVAGLPAAPVV